MRPRFCALTLAAVPSVSVGCDRGDPTPKKLQYIANREELAPSRVVEVMDSYVSTSWSPTGDHVDLFRLRLEPRATGLKYALRRDQVVEPLFAEAIETVGGSRTTGTLWFPDAESLKSERFLVAIPELTAYHGRVETVQLTALDTVTGFLYHADVAW